MFLSYLCDQVLSPKITPLYYPPITTPLSPATLFLLLSLQQLMECHLPQNKEVPVHSTFHPQKVLQFYQLFILTSLSNNIQQLFASFSLITPSCVPLYSDHILFFSTIVIPCFHFVPPSSLSKIPFFSSNAIPHTLSPSTNSHSNFFPRSPSL